MRLPRASGILLHPTSLPGRHGIGDLGPSAYQFVDFLVAAEQRLWQILPLGPTGYGDSPYASFSAFAGNPLLVSPQLLVEDGLLPAVALDETVGGRPDRVDYDAVTAARLNLLRRAFERFRAAGAATLRAEFEAFRETERAWLDDYTLFMALREAHGGVSWSEWSPDIRSREAAALAGWRERLADDISARAFAQWQFFRQWRALRAYANQRQVRVIGDLPIFVAYDSADAWSNPDLFYLDEQGRPTVVAGVPPDYFSATGQLWGNPLYRWDRLAATNYDWWIRRFQATFALVDITRIDHFRGFAAYWEVPASEKTAVNGRWRPGPGAALFEAVRTAIGPLPIIAEDLGLITPDVLELRDRLDFPGMAVLQFAFGGDATNPYLPHSLRENLVVYTGTHDNDTTRGWHATSDEATRDHVRRYLGRSGDDIAWDMIRVALASVCDTAIIPLQDALDLGNEARMNVPGNLGGNWSWRARPDQFQAHVAARLADLTRLYGRDAATEAEHAKQAAEREQPDPYG